MPGGLLNLVSYGNQNIHLNGNPTKTFFKATYAKYTNFGLQKFRIDFDGQRGLRLSESSTFTFKIPHYADLLMDAYLCINLPHIWSPIHQSLSGSSFYPYEFKWIKNIGCMMIEEVQFTIGGQVIQKFSGDYLHNMVERDFDSSKKELFNRMTANVPEINDPAQALSRFGNYPNVWPRQSDIIPEPSIRERKLTIPLNLWFMMASKMALPLASLKHSEVKINITIRPVQDLFTILDVGGATGTERIRPNFDDTLHSFYRFVHPPPLPSSSNTLAEYDDQRTIWTTDVHLLTTYAFLGETEVRMFENQEQTYLIKEVHENSFKNIVGTTKVDLKSMGLVSDWTWYLRRTDVILRNEWSNYTNWSYMDIIPNGLFIPIDGIDGNVTSILNNYPETDAYGNEIYITGDYSNQNEKKIMTKFAIIIDGKYRENDMESDVFEWIEKYSHTNGNGPECLYTYNFGLNTNPYSFQPSGAMNTTKFGRIEFEISTIEPPLDPEAKTYGICDVTGQLIGTNKPTWEIYKYTYDVFVIEHRYNILKLSSGMATLLYAR